MSANPRDHSTVNVVDRVGTTSVLGEADIVVVWDVGLRIENHILEDRAEANGIPDFRLSLFSQVDALCVAAAFKVENAGCPPSVLVVSNQVPFRVGGERCLTGARESKEQSRVSGLAGIGGAVHGENIALGQEEIHDAENRFLHFAGIFAAADDNEPAREIHNDEYF